MIRNIIIISKVVFICSVINIRAQDSIEMWVKFSTEIRMNIENSPWEFRLRPDDHIFLPSKYVPGGSMARIDFMAGIIFWEFKAFSYTKYDQSGGFWTGPRLDFNFELLNEKLLFNIQERYFFGLNEQSNDHYYLIQYIRYEISKMMLLGVLSYGKWEIDKPFNKGCWFIGPTVEMNDKSGICLQVGFLKDIFLHSTYMTYIKLSYNFMVKDRSKPISIEDEEVNEDEN